jgi:hypothetical protein
MTETNAMFIARQLADAERLVAEAREALIEADLVGVGVCVAGASRALETITRRCYHVTAGTLGEPVR